MSKKQRILLFKVVYETYKQDDLEKLLVKENVLGTEEFSF